MVQQAAAIVVIVGFAAFVVWGRTAGGRRALARLYGAPAKPARKAASSTQRPKARPKPAAKKRAARR